MYARIEHQILNRMLGLVEECLTPEVAERIVALRADDRLEGRLDRLAERNSEGKLTPRERAEYAAYVEALDVMAIIQAKARKVMRQQGRQECLPHRSV